MLDTIKLMFRAAELDIEISNREAHKLAKSFDSYSEAIAFFKKNQEPEPFDLRMHVIHCARDWNYTLKQLAEYGEGTGDLFYDFAMAEDRDAETVRAEQNEIAAARERASRNKQICEQWLKENAGFRWDTIHIIY